MDLMIALAIFVVSVGLLIASAKFFTGAAETLGYRFGLSSFVVGVVIVSVGTSLPELISSVLSVRSGSSEIVPGNIIGSSLSNILFVLGLTVVLSKSRIDLGAQYIYIDLNYLAGAALIVVVIMFDGVVHASEAFIGLLAYGAYVFYLLRAGNTNAASDALPHPPETTNSTFWSIGILIASGVVIFFSANQTIDSLSKIAETLGVSKAIVSMTLLSIGTTLPECVVSVSAARAGKAGLAVGNVLGSCIFNGLMIPGVASLFGTLTVPVELIHFSLPFYAAVTLIFYLLTQDKKISPFEGTLLLLIYTLFMGKVTHFL
ncbi:sodium:calcium antiporter [Pirellulaceae bacterium SH501]